MTLQLESSVVHWDERLLPAITRIEKVEKLPVMISANRQKHLLGDLKLISSCGDDITATFHNLMKIIFWEQ